MSDLPLVKCHAGEINQVVLNLVVNAAHAIGDAGGTRVSMGKINIRTRHDGKYALLEVSDTGCGISEEQLGRIFDPFFTTKEVGRGTGQGLAISRAIVVDRHGGTLGVASDVGKGTTFTVRLPLQGDMASAA